MLLNLDVQKKKKGVRAQDHTYGKSSDKRGARQRAKSCMRGDTSVALSIS